MFRAPLRKKVAIISAYSIKWLNYITEFGSVYCAVKTGSVYKIHIIIIKRIKSNFSHGIILKKISCMGTHTCVCVCGGGLYIYTGCLRRNVPNVGSVFLRLKYTDITQKTYIQS